MPLPPPYSPLPPLAAEQILAHPRVHDAFQTDGNYHLLHASSPRAERSLLNITSGIDWAAALTRKAGLAAPTGMIMHAAEESFMLISMVRTGQNGQDELRLFGLFTEPQTSDEEMADFITQLG